MLQLSGAAMAQDVQQPFPLFRHVDHAAKALPNRPGEKIVLLADQDFAPWSFEAPGQGMKGISVELALAACAELQLDCSVKALPFEALLPALLRGEGDAVVTGLKVDDGVALQAQMTRPYFVSMGRFVTRMGSPLTSPDVRTLAGRRIGYVKGTSHGAFVEAFYGRSALTSFPAADTMLEALRTGAIEAAFGDAVALSYWMQGSAARNCCIPLGRAFIDRNLFSRNLVFLARADSRDLKSAFDQALDRLETKGITGQIFMSYLPGSVW